MSRGRCSKIALTMCATLGLAATAGASDEPISAIKLIMKISDSGKEKLVFVSKDPAYLFPPIGGLNDPANGTPGGATVEILTRDGGNATFNVPPGESLPPGWKVKDATIDLYKYINKDAPGGPVALKVVVMKDTKVLKVVGKDTGLPMAGTLGDVVVRITTGTDRNCARFDAATIRKDEPGQFIAYDAMAGSLVDCASGPPTTVTTTTTSTSTSSSTSSTTTTSTSTSSTTSTSTSSTTTTSTSSTSTSTSSTTTTSTSSTTTTSTSTSSTTTTSTSSTTSTSAPRTLRFITGAPGGPCGSVRSGGTSGTVRKTLGCGGLNVGGGNSTVAEGPTPDLADTLMKATCTSPPTCVVSARTAGETGSINNCSDTGCAFGPYLPIANSGTSTCVRNTFATPASGTLISNTGVFNGSFPLTSTVYLTANDTTPCPLCQGGTPGVTNSGVCQIGWLSGAGPSPDEGAACTPVNVTGNSHDCDPPAAVVLPSFPVSLNPITTGTAFFFNAGGLFCPSQANSGAFGCSGGASTGTPSICPSGTTAPLINYVAEVGTATGPVTAAPTATKLASVFCIPSVGGSLGFLINGAANLPGPGATSLPGTFALVP